MVKEEKVWEKEAPNAIAKSFVTISRVSPSPPFADWLDEAVSSAFQALSTKKLVVC